MQPPPAVLDVFGARADPTLLPGGQGTSWRAGDIVLKPCRSAAEAALYARVYAAVRQRGFRLPQPRQSKGGAWTSRGWSAWAFVEGSHRPGRWADKIAAAVAFHRALAGLPQSATLMNRDDPWTRADCAAWDEQAIPLRPGLRPIVAALRAVLRPIVPVNQLIHGDMCGNILFAPDGDPYIIDFTPFWRPAGYALGLLVAEALVWERADSAILDLVDDQPDFIQLLARAHLRRLIELETVHQRHDLVHEHWPTAQLICRWARGR